MSSNLRYIINSATGTVISANGESNVAKGEATPPVSTPKKPAAVKKLGKPSSVGKAPVCKSHQKAAKTRGDELIQLICEWYHNFSDGPVSYTRLYKISKMLSEKLGLKRLPPRWVDVLREDHAMLIVALPACFSKPKSAVVVVRREKPILKRVSPKLLDEPGPGAAATTVQPVDIPEKKMDIPTTDLGRSTVVVLSCKKEVKEVKPVVPPITLFRKSVIIKEEKTKIIKDSQVTTTTSSSQMDVDQQQKDLKLKLVDNVEVSSAKDVKPEGQPQKYRLISSAKISDEDASAGVMYSTPVIKLELLKQ